MEQDRRGGRARISSNGNLADVLRRSLDHGLQERAVGTARLRRQAGCKNLVLNSNGTLLDRWDNIDRILNSPLKRFILSLDGLSKETFELIREKAKWEEVYPAVERLCAERIRRRQKYPAIVAQFSVMRQNAHEVDAYRKYWNARGAEVKIRPMLEWTATGTVRTDTIVHDSQFRIACPWGNNTMAIHQDGSVVACAVDYEGRFRPVTSRTLPSRRRGAAWASGCASRIANTGGTTFPISARDAATGRLPALNMRRKAWKARGPSGTTMRLMPRI